MKAFSKVRKHNLILFGCRLSTYPFRTSSHFERTPTRISLFSPKQRKTMRHYIWNTTANESCSIQVTTLRYFAPTWHGYTLT